MTTLPCDYVYHLCPAAPPIKGRTFTTLLLKCWQREYDKRPYLHFKFRRLDFEERMSREYHNINDFGIIVNFLQETKLFSISICSIEISNTDTKLLRDFVHALCPVFYIELKLMQLPLEFFVILQLNVDKTHIIELSLEGSPLSDADVSMLHKFLIASKTLKKLNVASCSISQYNFANIADGVFKSKSINSLNASRLVGLELSLDTEKLASILGSLLMQQQLVELTMEKCELTAQDMEIIAEYLGAYKCPLTTLNLAYNRIGADGTLFLLRGIVRGQLLEILNISGNGIGTHGGEWIAQHLCECLMLCEIYLCYNEIDSTTINLILRTIKKPTKLRKLHLYGNQFDAGTASILRRLLDAEVVKHEELDISYVYDEALEDYRVVPWR